MLCHLSLPHGMPNLPAQLQLQIHQRLSADARRPLIGADLGERLRIDKVDRRRRIAPGVVMEHVLEVQPDLEIEALLDRDVLLHRPLRVEQARSSDDIAAGVADQEAALVDEGLPWYQGTGEVERILGRAEL